jgi:hypothetical protein
MVPVTSKYRSFSPCLDGITPCSYTDQIFRTLALETGVDATTLDSYTFTVPEVTPTSKIYFLQFTPNTGNATQVTWTTRFTVSWTCSGKLVS